MKVPDTETRAADPEALLLTSLEVATDDPALRASLESWLAGNRHLLNTHRLQNLCSGPEDSQLLASLSIGGTALREHGKPDLTKSINFAFRLRAFLGLTARAEVLRALLGSAPHPQSLRDLAENSGFSRTNTHKAILRLTDADLVAESTDSVRLKFTVEPGKWLPLLSDQRGVFPDFMPWPEYLLACRVLLRWLRSDSCACPGPGYRFQINCDDLLLQVHRAFIIEAGTPATWSGDQYVYMEEMTDYLQRALGPLEIYG